MTTPSRGNAGNERGREADSLGSHSDRTPAAPGQDLGSVSANDSAPSLGFTAINAPLSTSSLGPQAPALEHLPNPYSIGARQERNSSGDSQLYQHGHGSAATKGRSLGIEEDSEDSEDSGDSEESEAEEDDDDESKECVESRPDCSERKLAPLQPGGSTAPASSGPSGLIKMQVAHDYPSVAVPNALTLDIAAGFPGTLIAPSPNRSLPVGPDDDLTSPTIKTEDSARVKTKWKRNKPTLSCLECVERKTKCDRSRPCLACVKRQSNCEFSAIANLTSADRRYGGLNSKARLHVESHPDSQQYRCQHCGKGYQLARSLREHVKLDHEEHAQFPCPVEVCPKAYGAKKMLNRHLRIKHPELAPEKPERSGGLGCPVPGCPTLCSLKWNLETHIISKHPEVAAKYVKNGRGKGG